MSAQHTPGPWLATVDGDWWMVLTEAKHSIGDEEDGQIPVVDLFHGGYDYSEFDLGCPAGNARLIAAAPDLLAAAEMFASLANDGNGRSFPTIEQCAFASRAIAKARGEVA